MATKPRSPNYPGVSLQKALEYARKVYAANHLHKAPREVVARAMGYGTLNGGSLTAISALKKYGLLDEDGEGMRITNDALTALVESSSSPERARMLVKLATMPELFAEMQSAYPGPAPNDEILRSWLLRKGFLQTTVDLPIRAYRETMELAHAQKSLYTDAGSGSTVKQPEQKRKEEQPDELPPEVGDLIQWEASGVLQMDTPRRVRAKQEHEGSWWVFVEGSEKGIPMEETAVVERKVPDVAAKQPPVLPLVQPPEVRAEATVAKGDGEVEASRGKLGDGVAYRLLVTGEMRSKQIGKLIKLLEAQKAVLEDDDEM
jgi:hypothetical protein